LLRLLGRRGLELVFLSLQDSFIIIIIIFVTLLLLLLDMVILFFNRENRPIVVDLLLAFLQIEQLIETKLIQDPLLVLQV